MDYQTLFNLAIGVAGFFGAWIMHSTTKALDRLDTDVRAMPANYVSKVDYRQDLTEIKGLLMRIDSKFDTKADKD